MNEPLWISELFKEKGLWAAYLESKKFPTTSFNRRFEIFFLPISFLLALFTFWFLSDTDETLRGIDAGSYLLATVAATIIGFLVAGLAIFTTLSDKKILIVLAQTEQKGTNVTAFKYLYFNLLNVFVVYIRVLVISFFVQVAAKMAIPVKNIDLGTSSLATSDVINGIVLSVLLLLFMQSMLSLKTFIWNIYATFLSVLTVSTVIEPPKD